MDKKWYTSKTVWVTAIAMARAVFGPESINPQLEIGILAAVAFILRLITKTNVTW